MGCCLRSERKFHEHRSSLVTSVASHFSSIDKACGICTDLTLATQWGLVKEKVAWNILVWGSLLHEGSRFAMSSLFAQVANNIKNGSLQPVCLIRSQRYDETPGEVSLRREKSKPPTKCNSADPSANAIVPAGRPHLSRQKQCLAATQKIMQCQCVLGMLCRGRAGQWVLLRVEALTNLGVVDHTTAEAIDAYMKSQWAFPGWDDFIRLWPRRASLSTGDRASSNVKYEAN